MQIKIKRLSAAAILIVNGKQSKEENMRATLVKKIVWTKKGLRVNQFQRPNKYLECLFYDFKAIEPDFKPSSYYNLKYKS